MPHELHLKRVYEPPSPSDGRRILVDRLWPRGLSKAEADIDLWLKDVAPSAPLRKWFGHRPERWSEFRARYRDELKTNPALDRLRQVLAEGKATLVYGAKDQEYNQAVVLAEVLKDR
jgi:uncharacterized protein YeaO (DUF488 family)